MKNKAMLASLMVACLMVVSIGAFAAESTGSTGEHYTDIDQVLEFSPEGMGSGYLSVGERSALTINNAVGSEVCNYNNRDCALTFTASCNLRGTSDLGKAFMVFSSNNSTIQVNEGVEVHLATDSDIASSDEVYATVQSDGDLSITGKGKLTISVLDPKPAAYFSAILINPRTDDDQSVLTVDIKELNILSRNHSCVIFSKVVRPCVVIEKSHVDMEGKYVFGTYQGKERSIDVEILSGSWVKFVGTEKAFIGKTVNIIHPDVKLYASMSYRATDTKEFDASDVMKYQYVSTQNNTVSGLVIPLAVVFAVICVILFFFVFIRVERPSWEQEKINAEKAKVKAEKAALKAEMDKKKAEERKIAEEKKAKEMAEKAALKAEMDKKKAEERKIAEEQRAKKKAELEAKRAAEAQAKEAAKKKAEIQKAKQKEEAKKKKAQEAKEKEEAKKAIEAKKAKEAKQKEEAKKAQQAKKEAEKAAKKK